ncbi:putative SET domain-containing protein [Septoria linicola]|nr:putative SET domain-containing protein [Septoria linicola]
MATAQVFEVRASPGKGYGVFATRNIKKGTQIMHDKAFFRTSGNGDPTNDEILRALGRLSEEDQNRFMALEEGQRHESKVLRIFHNNCFASDHKHGKAVYPNVSRFNHSCRSNAWHYNGRIIAKRNIKTGEEFTITYNEVSHQSLTASQRGERTWQIWGFRCDCVACSPSDAQQLSDARRQLISAILNRLDDREALKNSRADWLKSERYTSHQPSSALTRTQRVEHNFLLARLREAEELSPFSVISAYAGAAMSLAEYVNTHMSSPRFEDLLPVAPARYIHEWINTALQMAQRSFPHGDQCIVAAQKNYNNIHGHWWMSAAEQNLPASVFAVKMHLGTGTARPEAFLTQAEFKTLMRQRLRQL